MYPKEIKQTYISKHNETCNIHANLLMITDGTGTWQYLAIKKHIRIIKRSNIKT